MIVHVVSLHRASDWVSTPKHHVVQSNEINGDTVIVGCRVEGVSCLLWSFPKFRLIHRPSISYSVHCVTSLCHIHLLVVCACFDIDESSGETH